MQGYRVKIVQQKLVRPFTKISRTSHEGKVTILRNQQVQTDRTIPNKTPDIIIRDNKQETCILIDVAILGDRNAIKKEGEKIFIYFTGAITLHVA